MASKTVIMDIIQNYRYYSSNSYCIYSIHTFCHGGESTDINRPELRLQATVYKLDVDKLTNTSPDV